MSEGCGIFSFNRHNDSVWDPDSNAERSAEEHEAIWFQRSCNTMVHEIGHMFGLKHCIHYECLMNGSNGSWESERNKNNILCAVCLTKLKINAKFDCRERY